MKIDYEEKSKFLSYILRHKPESIGMQLTSDGWAAIDVLCSVADKAGAGISRDDILTLAQMSENGRFEISDDEEFVRATFGHSIAGVKIQRTPMVPPEFLYHGTAMRFLDSILDKGLLPGERHYVHLSSDATTAFSKGKRYGKPILLKIKAQEMHKSEYTFYRAPNGSWLVESVPVVFFDIMPN